MRYLPLFGLILVGCNEKPASPPSAQPIAQKLDIGGLAPPLTVTRWLHGAPVTLEAGRVYVVVFWTAWDSESKIALHKLADIARDFQAKVLTIIGVTSLDHQGNSLARVEEYIKNTGKNFDIHFAWCGTAKTQEDWMEAAGLSGIPVALVVDRELKIAYIDHPEDLRDVLPKVLDSTWMGRDDAAVLRSNNEELYAIFDRVQRAGDAAQQRLPSGATLEMQNLANIAAAKEFAPDAIVEYEAFEKKHPRMASTALALMRSMTLYLRVGRFDDAKRQAEKLLTIAAKTGDDSKIEFAARQWLLKVSNPERKHLDVAVRATDLLLKARSESDLDTVLAVAQVAQAQGNDARYREFAAKARKLSEHEPALKLKVEYALK